MKKNDTRSVVTVDRDEQLGTSDNQPQSYKNLSRRDLRGLIFHLLYAVESFDYQESLAAIVDNFNRGFDLDISLESEAVKMAQSILDNREQLDELYKPLLENWRFERIGVSTKLILRFATWELEHTETNPSIVINEAIELAKCFAEKDSYRFINGVLDRMVKTRVARE